MGSLSIRATGREVDAGSVRCGRVSVREEEKNRYTLSSPPMLLAFTLFYMITQCRLASSSRALSIDVPDVPKILPADGRGNLFLQLVPDEVPSTDDLADLEDTVCLEALERFRSIRVPEGGRVDWEDSR